MSHFQAILNLPLEISAHSCSLPSLVTQFLVMYFLMSLTGQGFARIKGGPVQLRFGARTSCWINSRTTCRVRTLKPVIFFAKSTVLAEVEEAQG